MFFSHWPLSVSMQCIIRNFKLSTWLHCGVYKTSLLAKFVDCCLRVINCPNFITLSPKLQASIVIRTPSEHDSIQMEMLHFISALGKIKNKF